MNLNRSAALRTLDVGVDLDDVVYSFVGALRTVVHTRTGRPLASMPEPTCWDFHAVDWGMPLEEFLDHFAAGINSGIIFGTGEPLPGAIEGMRQLSDAGHRLHIVTDRGAPGDPAIAHASTRAWLADVQAPYTSLTFSRDKTVAGDLDIFIDDRVENYVALEAAGMNPVLMHRPHNAHYAGARRVRSWPEFVARVDALAGGLDRVA